MNTQEFWSLMDTFAEQPEEKQIMWLVDNLSEKPVTDIIDFRDICYKLVDNLFFEAPLNRVLAETLPKGALERYREFCIWLISRGSQTFNRLQNYPHQLGDLLEELNVEEPFKNEFATVCTSWAYLNKRDAYLNNGVDVYNEKHIFKKYDRIPGEFECNV
ncbi:DUF4240 domain-containing protein [Priestia filamentosa]|uniref:DUF4240 domain-containing protein n=1 Tax=Priestia filamentosa TaxID=1402861 RepID=UPI00397D978C